MSTWLNKQCYHKTLLSSSDGSEFLIVLCKYCRNISFCSHEKLHKTVLNHDTFESNIQYRCKITCSHCKRDLTAFPYGNEALILEFVNFFDRPHLPLTEKEQEQEYKLWEGVNITDYK